MTNKIQSIAHLVDTPIKRLAVSNGIYDCITDPYDKLRNGDNYSSVMPDLERFANLIIDECIKAAETHAKDLESQNHCSPLEEYDDGIINGIYEATAAIKEHFVPK